MKNLFIKPSHEVSPELLSGCAWLSRLVTHMTDHVNINPKIIYCPCVLDPSVIMFKNSTQNFNISDALYTVPVIRTQGLENPSTVNWRTVNSPRIHHSGLVKFAPGEMEKNIVIDSRTQQISSKPESFQLELYEPSTNSLVRDRKTTLVNIVDPRGEKTPQKFESSDSVTQSYSRVLSSTTHEIHLCVITLD